MLVYTNICEEEHRPINVKIVKWRQRNMANELIAGKNYFNGGIMSHSGLNSFKVRSTKGHST